MKPTNLSDLKASAAMMSQRLKVMSHSERLLMLCRMDEAEVSVNELVALTGLSQSAVSQHLALLRAEDVVNVRIAAQVRWYSLKDPIVSGIIHAMCELCDRLPQGDGAAQAAIQPSGAAFTPPTLGLAGSSV